MATASVPTRRVSTAAVSAGDVPSVSPAPIGGGLGCGNSCVSPTSSSMSVHGRGRLGFGLRRTGVVTSVGPRVLSLHRLCAMTLSCTGGGAGFCRVVGVDIGLCPMRPITGLGTTTTTVRRKSAGSTDGFLSVTLRRKLTCGDYQKMCRLVAKGACRNVHVLGTTGTRNSRRTTCGLGIFFRGGGHPWPTSAVECFVALLVLFNYLSNCSRGMTIELGTLPTASKTFKTKISCKVKGGDAIRLTKDLQP